MPNIDEVTKVKTSDFVEMSMRISKASYNKSEKDAMKWVAIDSDTDDDLYREKMSIELYRDFVSRIESKSLVPEPFQEMICEKDWCGGVPYLSIAHYKAGTGLVNVPGSVESVFIDGTRLKSKGTLHDNEMGRKVFDALREDLYMKEKSETDHLPVRISIGFLDLEHKHLSQVGGQEFTFTRTDVGQLCPLCVQGIGGKIYMKGQLIHLAMTRVPVNPRTEMSVERSMDEIKTKRDDAKSIIGELADELEEKSIASDMLVVRSDESGTMPTPDPNELNSCYDPNTAGWNADCIVRVMNKYMPQIRDEIGSPTVKSMPKSLLDAVVATFYKSNGYDVPVVEEAMEETKVTEKAVAGIPVKPFKFTQDGVTVTGDGNNTIPNPIKAETEPDEDDKNEKKEVKEMSALDKAFDLLKAQVAGKNVDEINKAFAELGTAVETQFAETKEVAPASLNDIANIVKSAVEAAVAPLRVELATLKAQKPSDTVSTVVKSKALTLGGYTRPDDMLQKRSVQPARKLTQIEAIARRSTGLQE